ncbi:hypothetical protein FCM35_KLT08631 [Carex littledalei]|uniref:Uncharacterized protein n=1 Tax=Carex littledalei TaxID=544730 RepID=A0A833QV11_9POAL|nr:hypothetical protein FCM35_KLT08631 [Carex littledalei]
MHSTLTSQLLELCHWPEETKKNLRHKLCLWHTPTLTPIFTHDKLEPIMASIHFSPIIPGPASTDSLTGTTSAGRENEGVNGEQGENLTSTESVQWRKYRFVAMHLTKDWGLEYCEKRSWPRLPYPRVDGLHLMSYLEFLGALECFIDPLVVANVFHIRATPIDSRDEIYKSVFREIKNLICDLEMVGIIPNFYFYREDTLDNASEETYGQLKASVDNVDISKYARKDGTRKIEEDERDDTSDFVCLIDEGDAFALCGEGYHGELSRDGWENTEACCTTSVDYLRDWVRCNEDIYWSRRKVVKNCPQLVDIYKDLLESLQR